MKMPKQNIQTNPIRRKLLKRSAPLVSIPLLGPTVSGLLLSPNRSEAALTPACDKGVPTLSQTAGPFYTPNSPLRDDLREADLPGQSMRISGCVLNQYCEPIRNAVLNFWHADSNGVYDNRGYRLRGHLFSDSTGKFVLKTIVPGSYPGRTRHIHVITQGKATRALTTQLYFPDLPDNQRDFGYHPKLELVPAESDDAYHFDFVLQENA